MDYLKHEPLLRLGFFGGVLVIMALGELFAPRRRLTVKKPLRWASNLGLVALNSVVARVLLPIGAVGMALFSEEHGWGLFNNIETPFWLVVVLCVVGLDLAIYLQHIMFHAVPILWRLHMVHHADLDFDVTTGLRFHTIEILLSMGIKFAVVVLLGAPALAVLIFEIALNATAMFNHANVRLPGWLDRVLRLVLVTPDMHRVHHSAIPVETNSNFGFNFPWWDLLFGTYRPQPEAGHEGMTIGLAQFRDQSVAWLHWMLALPFLGATGNYPVNRSRENDALRDGEARDQSDAAVVDPANEDDHQHVCS
ncbi:MAG: sterol desaturase family protein [Planctomycetes bacterium]|jgi:sterol desaturase/sphingolipid hydroxylase (fatty acid hydroxylase superfamily)|nr:sterol desaturase family protein [Planctomycetota bacterium]